MFRDTRAYKKIIYLCPSTPKDSCRWEGEASDILEHFQESHKELLMDSNAIKADVSRNIEQNRLMSTKKGLFLLQTKVCVESAKLWIRVRYLGSYDTSQIRYSVEVSSEKFGFTNLNSPQEYNPVFNVENGVQVDIQAINLMSCVHNIEYVTVRIHVNEQTESLITESEKVTRLNGEESELNEEKVIDTAINSSKENSVISDDEDNKSDERCRSVDDDEHLQELNLDNKWELKDIAESCEEHEDVMIKCTNCRHNMIPPIYMCPDGHSVCYNCKDGNCNVCEQRITELRNIDLEEHSKMLEYPCRYESYGCKEKHKCTELRKHEIYCEYFTYKCEFCIYEGRLVEIRSHYRIAHPSTKIYDRMIEIPIPKGSNFLIINSSGVFYCTSRATETYVEWKVIFSGPKERCFSCEVRVTGKKQFNYPKRYFLKRSDNVFKRTVPFDELRFSNVKEKYSMLFVSSY